MALNLINKLNAHHLKVFESVYRLKSMTLSAQELFLTQSGVSQHIKSFETELGLNLFVRNRSGLFATEQADLLYQSYTQAFGQINQTLSQIKGTNRSELEGIVRIGIPTEFGNNVVIPYLSAWAKKHTQVKFDFIFGYGLNMSEQLEKGEVDLAFIDSFQKNGKMSSRVVFQESLNLVTTADYLKEKKLTFKSKQRENINELLQMDYLDYEHQESILRLWFKYNYNKKNVGLNIRAWAMNVQGVASLVRQGLGVAILPDHVTEKLQKQLALHIFKGRQIESLKNDISLVWLKDKPRSRAVESLFSYIYQKNI